MVNAKQKALILFIFIDMLFFAAVLASGTGLLLWFILNVIAVIIWAKVGTRSKGARRKGARSYEYAEKEYGVRSITLKGETVKSKKEKIIADYLYQNKIRYEYEAPAYTRGRRRRLIGYPDFLLPDYDVYVEFWGMVNVDDHVDRERYVKHMKWKMAQYHRNGIKFISLYQSNLDNLDWVFRAKLKEATGIEFEKGSI